MFRLRYTVYIYIEMKKIRKTNIDRMKNIGKGIHMLSTDIGVDLGTASILVYIKGKGVVLKEPSVVAFDRDTNKIKAIGEEARLMLGRTPGNIVAVRPLRQGVISDYRVTEKMLKYFIQKAIGKRMLKKPRISVCVPSGVTEVEKKAVEDATLQAGAREVAIIEEPIAAAIGAGIDISRPCGNMIVDIGGGTTDIAVHSVLEKTPPELASDIADRGIVLTGGGSLLQGLEELIESKTGIHTMTAEDPMTAVAIGTGKFIEFLAGYRDDK